MAPMSDMSQSISKDSLKNENIHKTKAQKYDEYVKKKGMSLKTWSVLWGAAIASGIAALKTKSPPLVVAAISLAEIMAFITYFVPVHIPKKSK